MHMQSLEEKLGTTTQTKTRNAIISARHGFTNPRGYMGWVARVRVRV